MPMIPTMAATSATPAGFSAPLVVCIFGFGGGVTDFVADPVAVAKVVIGAVVVPFTKLAGAADTVAFAELTAKPELAVALGAGAETVVLLSEVVA